MPRVAFRVSSPGGTLREYISPFKQGSLWDLCYCDFLRHSRSPRTTEIHHAFLTQFFTSKDKLPDRYTRSEVERYIHKPLSRFDREASISTQNQRMSALSAFYRYAAEYWVEDDRGELVPLMRRPSPVIGSHYQQPEVAYRAMNEKELRKFFAIIPKDTVQGKRDRAIFLLFFWTARRREEIAALTWGDIEYGTIVDEDEVSWPGWLYHFRGKGRKSIDDRAELPRPAKDALDAYLEASGRIKTIQPGDPLFVATKGPSVSPLRSATMNHWMKRYAKSAGLNMHKLSLHCWRHTAAQQRRRAGESIYSLKRLLRHSSLAVTDRYVQGLMATADSGAKLLMEKYAWL